MKHLFLSLASTILMLFIATAFAEDPKVINFENIVIVDDDNVKITLENMYEEKVNWGENDGGPRVEKIPVFKVKNKSSQKIEVRLQEAYLGEEKVKILFFSGNTSSPAPGKSDKMKFYVDFETVPYLTAPEALEDLEMLEGTFEVSVGETSKNTYSVDFSLSKLLQNESVNSGNETNSESSNSGNIISDTEASQEVIYQIGDTISTDMAELTLNETKFGTLLCTDHGSRFLKPIHSHGGLSASDGEIYLYFGFNWKNTSSNEYSL